VPNSRAAASWYFQRRRCTGRPVLRKSKSIPQSTSCERPRTHKTYHRASSGKAGGYAPHSAVRLAEAGKFEQMLIATQTVPKQNPQFRILTEKTNSQMTAWYATGAEVIHATKSTSSTKKELIQMSSESEILSAFSVTLRWFELF
jgi:hypothetical protein